MVEALICTQNWLKPSDNDLNVLNMTEEYEISESIVSEFQVATGGAAAPTQARPVVSSVPSHSSSIECVGFAPSDILEMTIRQDEFSLCLGQEEVSMFSAFLILLFINGSFCFYLPGVAPQDFQKGDELQVKVNKLTSTKTQLPYTYYSLPYCTSKKIVDSAENLGEVLRGDRIENSRYVFKMREPQMCNIVCKLKLDTKTAKAFKEKIDDEYRVNMILDNLPLVVPIKRVDQDSTVYQLGFHVGLKGQYSGSKEEKFFIHNHLAFTVRYHRDLLTESARIVGFEVKPFSVKHEYEGKWEEKTRLTTCDPHAKLTTFECLSFSER
ncbi:Transmembrane 9 super member 8, variant 2 [Lathyrus oleraceus]|uniref:Transmembrane 9 superfamily member n=1 Tax=Pisum sativum TaxID=3888 RepID=A0A9D4WCX3_PEA|nr:Transmembrane 9 super member 8, variant 2 [Pisum sativum]